MSAASTRACRECMLGTAIPMPWPAKYVLTLGAVMLVVSSVLWRWWTVSCVHMKHSCLTELCTWGFANCQPNSNEGVAEGHDCCHNGNQPELIQVGDLTQEDLKCPKYEQERIVWYLQQTGQSRLGRVKCIDVINCSSFSAHVVASHAVHSVCVLLQCNISGSVAVVILIMQRPGGNLKTLVTFDCLVFARVKRIHIYVHACEWPVKKSKDGAKQLCLETFNVCPCLLTTSPNGDKICLLAQRFRLYVCVCIYVWHLTVHFISFLTGLRAQPTWT